jgi:hypothetical protein
MLDVLCFDCGGMYQVEYGTKDITKQCPKCKDRTQQTNIYLKLNREYSIVTAPRVGSYYLQDRILQHTGVYIKKYHSPKDNKMITIVRDPIDMLTSKLAMTAFYDKNNETIEHIRNSKENIKDLKVYIDSLNGVDLDTDFYILIDYRDLIDHPVETTIAVANILNLPIINKEYKDGNIREYSEKSHLITSKKVSDYEEIKAYVEQLDLSKLYDFYNKALAKCINIL